MKKYLIVTSALLLAMALGLTASHATTHMPATPAPVASSQDAAPKGMMGKVVTVDMAKSELAVKDDKGTEKTLSIAATTKITKDGKDITLSEVKTGDRVMYELEATTEPPVAKSLLVMAKAAKP